MTSFAIADIPSQAGKTVIITGTGALGYEDALALAGKGAEVILAGRNARKGAEASAAIKRIHPQAKIGFEMFDLADLASVATFAQRFMATHRKLDILINNAAVMAPPQREVTKDGFEMQFGTNYLGHFALTAHLLPVLRTTKGARVVNLSSLAHRGGKIHFSDLQFARGYKSWAGYQQSKLAMLMFALELQRRSDAHNWGLMSNAAHPGYARTDLIANGPGDTGFFAAFSRALGLFMSHSAAAGALPTLFAATSPLAKGGSYYGPNGFYELKGATAPSVIAPQAKKMRAAAKLWDVSENLTGFSFNA
jgi:NAD(P)-dependent dehydrogenase (short-subunit alcohol dehydrogenase family)